jgi:hypothetical protein
MSIRVSPTRSDKQYTNDSGTQSPQPPQPLVGVRYKRSGEGVRSIADRRAVRGPVTFSVGVLARDSLWAHSVRPSRVRSLALQGWKRDGRANVPVATPVPVGGGLRRDRAPLMGAYGEWTRDSDIVRRLWGHGEASSSSAPSRGGLRSMAVKEYKAMNVEPLRHSPEQRTSRCPGGANKILRARETNYDNDRERGAHG